jgi:hypothetical protein
MQHFTLTMTFLMPKVMSSVRSPACRYEKLRIKMTPVNKAHINFSILL